MRTEQVCKGRPSRAQQLTGLGRGQVKPGQPDVSSDIHLATH